MASNIDSSCSDTDPWIIARDKYVSDLSTEERQVFEQATAENIFLNASGSQNQHQDQSRAGAIMRRLKTFLPTIEDFGAAFDVISNTYSMALAPLWGSLRVVFMLATKYDKIFERIVDVLETIDYVIPRFRDYEIIFGKHPRIVVALIAEYLDILTLCGEIKVFIRSISNPE